MIAFGSTGEPPGTGRADHMLIEAGVLFLLVFTPLAFGTVSVS